MVKLDAVDAGSLILDGVTFEVRVGFGLLRVPCSGLDMLRVMDALLSNKL